MRKLLAIFLFITVVTAQIQLISPIPLPSNVIIDLDPEQYDDKELSELLQRGEIFSFLAKSKSTQDPELEALRESYMTLFNVTGKVYSSAAFRVAFIVPYKKIGKYAYSTSNSALAYLLNRKVPFEMELIPIADENNSTLQGALEALSGSSFDLIVAPVTMKGAQYFCSQVLDTDLFIPTLHKNRIDCVNSKIGFGGIDYSAQIEILSYLVEDNATNITVSDGTTISKMLSQTVASTVDVADHIALDRSGYYKELILRHEDLNQSTIFLNTPVVKSSLFLSQLTLADYKPLQVLSTQINYSPLLLTLTQYHDRENMVVASSIGELDAVLSENIALVNQDIRFNWLNYATVSGLDYYFTSKTGERRLSEEAFTDGSIDYDIKLYEAGLYRFVPKEIPMPQEDDNGSIIEIYDDETNLEDYDSFQSDSIE